MIGSINLDIWEFSGFVLLFALSGYVSARLFLATCRRRSLQSQSRSAARSPDYQACARKDHENEQPSPMHLRPHL
jgi:hypothetical protein